jgi:PqqD family protein of HPr-rel-A system
MKNLPRWRAASGSSLHWHSWDDEFIVYDSGSGQTHLLDPIAAETLKILEAVYASDDELFQLVAESLRIKPNGELASYLEKLLPKLERLGLIERIQR